MSELDDYDYPLPRDLIAQHPLPRRDDARLLIVDRRQQTLEHAHIRNLPEILRPGDCLAVNDTQVLPARLVGRRITTGGRWEGLFLDADAEGRWQVLGKTRGRLQAGETIALEDLQARPGLQLQMVTRLGDGSWLAQPHSKADPMQLLEEYGRVPLPHYIRRGRMEAGDRRAYQTVFASQPGAVAAPTAGLHFTEHLLARLSQAGIARAHVTLHIGVGTFRPISTPRLGDHQMHSEWGAIGRETVQQLCQARDRGGRIVAVGTTAVRVLETAAAQGTLQPWQGRTSLFIRPPYTFQATDALLTNLHLPRSTLLVLVHAFGGHALVRRAYDEAVAQQYRFYSYGDAMLIM